MELIFLELAAIIVLATVLGFVFKKIKQPELVGFIVAGIILGSLLNIITYQEIVVVFSDIGIAFLLFLVGINLDWRILKDIGKLSLTAGLGQILITAIASFFAARLIGFGVVESLYIGIALTFSSTIVGVKLLSDKNELNSLHGRIALGILLIQDFAAILVLIFISSFSSGSMPLLNQIARFVFSIVVLLGVFYLLSKFVVRPLFDRLAKYPELLFLGSIAWCFALASFALLLGFSKEIGAFIAGITLASIPYSYEISGKLKYLRDFFIVLFFVFLGTRAVFASFDTVVFPAIVLSIFVLIIDPVVVFLLA
ncbi:MAG: cation:proton antiporter, partial [Candidatus Diapherotrites archaeon]|nr:cation:proton antiporter [Candidatus Diapherotrites archaeon]